MGLRPDITLPEVRSILSRTIALASKILTSVKHKHDDHLGFIGAAFLAKQIGHAEAVLSLRDHQDTQLIARSMLEGLSLLHWAAKDSPGRPLRFRYFAYVLDWRRMNRMDDSGEPVEPERRASIEAGLSEHGHLFKSRRGRNRPDDPYDLDWPGRSLRSIFADAVASELYDNSYHVFSAWHHWSPGGLGLALSHAHGVTVLKTHAPEVARVATSHAAGALFDVAALVNRHLALGFDKRLTRLADAYKDLHDEPPRRESVPSR